MFELRLAVLLSSIADGGLQFMLIMWLQGIWPPLHGFDFQDTPLTGTPDRLPTPGRLHPPGGLRTPARPATLDATRTRATGR